ncbi:hypothetical protein [Marivita sp.]|jgi:hypothetical protein|uniref:hypothetical protein n=1 Tax=Marivita sp. TaxID=2003365 RepID=UPI003F72F5FB
MTRLAAMALLISLVLYNQALGGIMKECGSTPVETSRCVIEAILRDISETYTGLDGGGISSITQDATWKYTVAISREERIDLITYTVVMDEGGTVQIVDREKSTKSY